MKISANIFQHKLLSASIKTGTVGALVLLSSCASVPDPDPRLVSLQNRYENVVAQPYASQEADDELDATLAALAQGREANQERDEEALEHDVVVATKNLDIAEVRIQLFATQEQIAQASEVREAMLLDARERELARAEAETRPARRETAFKNTQLAAQQQTQDIKEDELRRQQQLLQQNQQELGQTREVLETARNQAIILAQQIGEISAKETERGTVLVLSDIVFDTDSSQLKPGSDRVLSQVAEFLVSQEAEDLVIEGHTDAIGEESYNLDLSMRRANAVRDALVKEGVPAASIRITGLGEEFPVASNNTAEGRQLNRRVEIILNDQVDNPLATL
jgi:outer membrane protein OmpA-like peptidoglycan-associated protein